MAGVRVSVLNSVPEGSGFFAETVRHAIRRRP